VAEALEAQTGESAVEALAYHYGQGGRLDKAVAPLEQAGDRAWTQHAAAAAAGSYRELVDALDRLGRAAAAAAAREKLGMVLRSLAQYEEALAVLEQAAQTYEVAGELDSTARTLAQVGRVHALRGTQRAGIERLQALLPTLEARPPTPGLAALSAELANLFFHSGSYQEELAAADRAADIARLLNEEHLLAPAAYHRGMALVWLGRTAEGQRALDEAIARAEAVGDLNSLCDTLDTVGLLYTDRGDFERGRTYYERAASVADKLDDASWIAITAGHRGITAFYTGRWEQTRAAFDRGVALSRQAGAASALMYTLIWRGWLRLLADEPAAARRDLEEELALVEQCGDLHLRRIVQRLLAEHDLREGRPADAQARMAPLLDRPGLEELDVTRLLPHLAWSHLELGQVQAAVEVAQQAVRRARAEDLPPTLVDALWAQALVELRQGHREETARVLEEGLALARGMPYPYAEARFLHFYGELHVQKGEMGAAREHLQAALAIFRRLGARPGIAQTERALAALSQNPLASQNAPPWACEGQVTDAQWAQIAALLPSRARTGRPRADDRQVLEAILYKQRTGRSWAALPAELGDEATAHRRWREWQAAGLWAQIAAIIQAPSAPTDGRPAETGGPPLMEGG
jgi:tetratricopeptide (TPR) repeat protein